MKSIRFIAMAWLAASLTCMAPAFAQVQTQSQVRFTDVTDKAEIKFKHFKGNKGMSINLEEFGPGVCAVDYDGDGWTDIYFVNSRDRYGRGIKAQNALYHNNRDGTFTDVTDKAGVPGTAFGLGCVWGDYDNDGFPDLFVTQFGKNVLYHNNGDGTFTDVTDRAGVGGLETGMFHAGATFVDYDRDGKLDLYVGTYVAMDNDSQRYCKIAAMLTSCPPSAFKGSPNALYHNNGDGTFTNVTKKAKILEPEGKSLSVGAADFDNDGWPDIFVANDGVRAFLFRNKRDGTFEETAGIAGMAYSQSGQPLAAMCISLGDYNNDGLLDLYISDFQGSSDHVWRNDGSGFFSEASDSAGITIPTKTVLSFGGGFFDYDNDGWLDIFIANGHVYPEIEQSFPDTHYKQLNTVFHNLKNGKFAEVSAATGIASLAPRVGRGVAFLDFDNDGSVDVLVANNGDPPTLLHNEGGSGNHFVNFKLVGTKSNRDAMGARIRVVAGGISEIREIAGGGSYLSQSELRANFGLGTATRAELVEVSWPSGAKQSFKNVEADKFWLIVEGNPELAPQPIRPR